VAAGANFISLSNGSSAAGKVVIGYIADRYGRINVLFAATLVSAISVLGLWLPSTVTGVDDGYGDAEALFASYTVLYGIFAGAYVSLFPITLVELFGVQHFASVNGILYMMRGLATLVGTPAAGALIRGAGDGSRTSMAYMASSILVGCLLVGATGGVFWVRLEALREAH
jgi:MFS family permease